jgi:hypothetical protein
MYFPDKGSICSQLNSSLKKQWVRTSVTGRKDRFCVPHSLLWIPGSFPRSWWFLGGLVETARENSLYKLGIVWGYNDFAGQPFWYLKLLEILSGQRVRIPLPPPEIIGEFEETLSPECPQWNYFRFAEQQTPPARSRSNSNLNNAKPETPKTPGYLFQVNFLKLMQELVEFFMGTHSNFFPL